MKDELQKKLLELINSSQNFLVDQLPDVAKQLIEYNRIGTIGLLICLFMLFTFLITTGIYAINYFKKNYMSDSDSFICFIFSLAFVVLIAILFNTTDLVQSYLTPKAYLIKSLTGHK